MDSAIHMMPCSPDGSSRVLVTSWGGLSPTGIAQSLQIPVEGLAIGCCLLPMVTFSAGLGLVMDLLPGW